MTDLAGAGELARAGVRDRREVDLVDHPAHYGGRDDHYEAIKVIDAWGLGFCLGNTVKYIARAERKGTPLVDLKKAAWYLHHEIERREREETRDPQA
jgi:hypothetical protein